MAKKAVTTEERDLNQAKANFWNSLSNMVDALTSVLYVVEKKITEEEEE